MRDEVADLAQLLIHFGMNEQALEWVGGFAQLLLESIQLQKKLIGNLSGWHAPKIQVWSGGRNTVFIVICARENTDLQDSTGATALGPFRLLPGESPRSEFTPTPSEARPSPQIDTVLREYRGTVILSRCGLPLESGSAICATRPVRQAAGRVAECARGDYWRLFSRRFWPLA